MYIDELRKSKDKPQVAFHEFALSTGTYQNHLFCFFEGKDNAYYVPRIKRFTNDYYTIKCGNKDAVLSVHAIIVNKSEYGKYKLGFFIDRDFDKSIGTKIPPIFETPCYSIENLYVSLNVFKDILINEFHLSETTDKQLFDDLLNLYEMRQKEFHSAILLLNAWYSCLIDKKNQEGIKTGVSFKDSNLNEFISINLHNVTKNYDIRSLKDKFPNAIEIDEDTLNQKIKLFESVEQHKVFRGKYEMDFLLKIIKEMLLDSYKTKSIVKEKIRFSFGDGSSLNQEQLLNIFEAYAETPQILTDYMEIVTKEIIIYS
ncbi:MAG: DUF4435 domain-containing protein [Bacteroidales bacterium]|jgi:hypothetical protein|nr:DUF4435 domain-containing protein [Bacteroidales bacterium]